MAVTINIYEYFEVTFDDGEVKEGGSKTVAKTISAAGDVYEVKQNLASDGDLQVLWTIDVADRGIADFDFLWFETDKDCMVELTYDETGDDDGKESHAFIVNASTPFILGADEGDEDRSGAPACLEAEEDTR